MVAALTKASKSRRGPHPGFDETDSAVALVGMNEFRCWRPWRSTGELHEPRSCRQAVESPPALLDARVRRYGQDRPVVARRLEQMPGHPRSAMVPTTVTSGPSRSAPAAPCAVAFGADASPDQLHD